jgi:hypothetical protein
LVLFEAFTKLDVAFRTFARAELFNHSGPEARYLASEDNRTSTTAQIE